MVCCAMLCCAVLCCLICFFLILRNVLVAGACFTLKAEGMNTQDVCVRSNQDGTLEIRNISPDGLVHRRALQQ